MKSPTSPWKPETSKVYVPDVRNAWLMSSGLVPVSIDCRTVPDGSLMVRMKSVEPPGMPSTVARIDVPAVALNGIVATGAAPVISPVVSSSVAPRVTGGAAMMAPVPFMIAADLRW